MTGDNDDTPREHRGSDGHRHYESHPSGTLVIAESGPASPRNQFEIDLHGRVKSLEDSRSFWKWLVGLGLPLLFVAAGAILHDSMSEASKSAERVGEQRAEIRALQEQVRDLWLKLNKLTGVDQKPVTIVQAP